MPVNVLHTSRATSQGGRNGHTKSDDGMIDLNLSVPKDMGGPGKDATGFGLKVDHEVKVAGLSKEDAEKIVKAGHEACPYSKAVKGNIDVTVKTVAV